jgi:hypothetical protein
MFPVDGMMRKAFTAVELVIHTAFMFFCIRSAVEFSLNWVVPKMGLETAALVALTLLSDIVPTRVPEVATEPPLVKLTPVVEAGVVEPGVPDEKSKL